MVYLRDNRGCSIKGILFDKDDTLIDLEAFWYEPVCRLADKTVMDLRGDYQYSISRELVRAAGFNQNGLEKNSLMVAGTNRDIITCWLQILDGYGIRMKKEYEEVYINKWLKAINYFCKKYGSVQPRTSCLHKILSILRKQGLFLGVATSDDRDITVHCLKKLGVYEDFDKIIAADTVEHAKPAPDSAVIFSKDYQIEKNQIMMVGDSLNDMKFAQISGLTSVFLQNNPEEEVPQEADYSIQDLDELPDLFFFE